MVYGDSLSAAYGIDPKDGWVSIMSRQLSPSGVTVVNSSISGETSLGGASRIQADLARIKPSIVVIALGANDGLRGLPIADTRKNISAIISAVQGTKARVILVGIQIPPNYGLDYAQQFRDLFPDLAKAYRVTLVPFLLEGIADKLELFQADRLHPKAEAQPRIFANVLPAIQKVLGKTNPAMQKSVIKP
jgi:acyl-CoA thioesterase-1